MTKLNQFKSTDDGSSGRKRLEAYIKRLIRDQKGPVSGPSVLSGDNFARTAGSGSAAQTSKNPPLAPDTSDTVGRPQTAQRQRTGQDEAFPGLGGAPEVVIEAGRRVVRANLDDEDNPIRMEGLAVLGRSIQQRIRGQQLPPPLALFLTSLVEKAAVRGCTPDTSQGAVIGSSSGAVAWKNRGDTFSLYFRAAGVTTSYEPGVSIRTIGGTEGDIDLRILAPASIYEGPYKPSSNVAWVLQLDDAPRNTEWLQALGTDQSQVAEAIGTEPMGTLMKYRRHYLEFDRDGRFLGNHSAERRPSYAGEPSTPQWRMVS